MGHDGGGGDAAGAVGAVLAGGRGTRMGGAKATAELCGRPLILHPLAAVAEAGLEPLVVAKPETALPPLEAAVVREPAEPRHPLCGIVAALRHAGRRPVVVVACDMPLVSPALLAALAASAAPLVVPSLGGEPQPLLARYDPALLPSLEDALGDAAPLRRTIASLRPRLWDEEELRRFGDPARLLFNVNTPQDLLAAARLLSSAER